MDESKIVCIPTVFAINNFPDRRQARPTVKEWRCDLTALSQLYNLYFVAYNDTIQVFQPSFPEQGIKGVPELVLHPPISAPGLRPGIDRDDPHSITRLLIDFLGHEEILLATCDDGDVVAYRVEEIQRAVEDERVSPATNHPATRETRVFLHRNVGSSAWGLAIHREARMIAISANTHRITILAYGLTDSAEEPSETNTRDREVPASDNAAAAFSSSRRQDREITLTANHNIPAVSFDNTGNDPSGRWLFSSSIIGKTMLWDLHKPCNPARVFQMGWCADAEDFFRSPITVYGGCACPEHPHSAWGAIFLNVRSAQELPDPDDEDPLKIPVFKDVSDQKERFTVWKQKSAHHDPSGEVSASEMAISDDGSAESDAAVPEGDHQQDLTATSNTTPVDGGEDATVEFSNSEGLYDEGEHLGSEEEEDEFVDMVAMYLTGSADSLFIPETHAGIAPQMPQNSEDVMDEIDDETEEEGTEDDETTNQPVTVNTPAPHATPINWQQTWLSFQFRKLKQLRAPYCEIESTSSFQSAPTSHSPSLLITSEEIFLIQRPFSPTPSDCYPIIAMRQPLHPPSKLGLSILESSDRHCFFAQIPELGVFIIASPVGRAAVFRLTKTRGGIYGFRLEYLLPFRGDDESEVWAPSGGKLLGTAVGPVQGMYNVGERRWRVLMYYSDHTVVAFELEKRRSGGEIGLGDLVV